MFMLLNLEELIAVHKMQVRGIIQLGASEGEEVERLERITPNVVYVEANGDAYAKLKGRTDRPAFHALVWDEDGTEVPFHVTTYAQCSTTQAAYLWGLTVDRREVMRGMTLDTILRENGLRHGDYNFLVMDIEGAELRALRGFDRSRTDYVYTECQGVYENTEAALRSELAEFTCVAMHLMPHKDDTNGHWGDLLFIRTSLVKA